MEVIDNTTQDRNEKYKIGDVFKCWDTNYDSGTYDLIQVSYNPVNFGKKIICVLIHANDDNSISDLPDYTYDTCGEAIRALEDWYDWVEKVNAHIVLEDW